MTSLTIVIPTYNEKDNLKNLAERIITVSKKEHIRTEILVVDDNSPDGTADMVEELAKTLPIQLILRLEKKGLGSAILTGISAAQTEIIAVMDADLSHPPEAIPGMMKIIATGEAQLVIGSRRVAGGGTSEWIWYRKLIHWVALTIGSFLTPVKDITSGFFMFDKQIIQGVKLKPQSWKIALEIIVKGKYNKVIEYPIVFTERESGKSKMNLKEVFSYLGHLLSLTCYKLSDRPCPKD